MDCACKEEHLVLAAAVVSVANLALVRDEKVTYATENQVLEDFPDDRKKTNRPVRVSGLRWFIPYFRIPTQ